MKARIITTIVAALIGIAVPAAAQSRQDRRLADEISRAVSSYTRLTIFDDVSGHVENGIVTLRGKVTMPYTASSSMAPWAATTSAARGT